MSRILTLAFTALSLTLAACESRPTIRADGDPTANLSNYQTFGYFDRVSTDKNQYTTLVTTRLKDSTKRELEQRGFKYVESNPQLLVNFNVNIQNKTDVRSTPSAGYGYYGYRAGMYGAWAGYPQDIQTVHYQDGTLSVDLVDAAKQQLVWQGVAEGRIQKEAVENPGPAIDRVITEIFTKFPIPNPAAPKAS